VQPTAKQQSSSSQKKAKKPKISIELTVLDTASSFNSKTPTAEVSEATIKFKGISNQFMNIDACDGFILCCSPLKKQSLEALEVYIDFILTYDLRIYASCFSGNTFPSELKRL